MSIAKFLIPCSMLWKEDHCGTDESGKGDYFGPLVVAGVYVPMSAVETVTEWGVRDSKQLSERRVMYLAKVIANHLITHKCIFAPPDYNVHYKRFNNLNKMLAYGHAQVVEKLFRDTQCKRMLIDKFEPSDQTSRYLSNAQQLEVRQIPNGERDFAVACASIIARATFLKEIKYLKEKYDYPFARGASTAVKEQAVELSQIYGAQNMKAFAKVHFKMMAQ